MMIVEVGKAYKLQDGRECFCYIKSEEKFYIIEYPPNGQHYNTFTVDEQGFVIHNIDKEAVGERLLPFTVDSLDVL